MKTVLKYALLCSPLLLGALILAILALMNPSTFKYILISHVTDYLPPIFLAIIVGLLFYKYFSVWGVYATLLLPAMFGGGFPDYAYATGFALEHSSLVGVAYGKTLAYKLFHKNVLPNLIVMPLAILLGLLFLKLSKTLGITARVPHWWIVPSILLALTGALLHILVLDPLGY